LALTNLNRRLVVDCRGAHALLDLSGHGQERLLDIRGILRGGFQERNANAVGEFLLSVSGCCFHCIGWTHLGNCVLDGTLISHITLVTDQQLVDALGRVAVNLLQPLLDIVEGIHVCNIVDDADAVGTTIV
jgi:hypothetical protein